MTRFYPAQKTIIILLTFFVSSMSNSFAGGFSDSDPFSLRFDAALSRYGNYGDVLGAGGASTGSTFSSSTNPASTVVRNKKHEVLTISPQYTSITFDNDHELDLAILGGTYRINDRQKLEYGVATVDSSSDMRRGDPAGSAFTLEADIYTLGWAGSLGQLNKCGEASHFIGVNYSSQSTDTELGFGPTTVVSDKGDSDSINLGYLYHTKLGSDGGQTECAGDTDRNNLSLGVTLTFGDGDTDRTSLISSSGKSDSKSQSIRLGVGYRVDQGRYLYSDIQYGKFENTSISNVDDSIDVTRLFAGIQWQVPENPGNGFRGYLRAGFALDVEGNESQTLGIGTIVHSDDAYQLGADLGYQNNMFPEIRPEFGDSELINLSFRIKFKR